MKTGRAVVVCALLAAGSAAAVAQSLLTLPEDSQLAAVSQRVGLTDITVRYHRPLVKGRKVWGGLVPYGQVWRAGANENTTIEFSTPVTVEGQPLAKGIYGLHMIPGTDEWSIIFSKNSSSWGSFSYNKDEDALRVTVKPLASLRNELRGGKQYVWEGPAEAAQYCAQHSVALEEGLKWANQSIAVEERMENLMLKAQLLKALNRATEASAAKDRALGIGNVTQVYFYGRQLQAQGQQAEAMDIFRLTVKRFPDHWMAHMATARLDSSAGDFAGALKEVKTVQGMDIPEVQKPNLANLVKRLENKEDINK